MTSITAQLKTIRIAPRKVRLVAAVLRRKSTLEAQRALKFLTNRAARPLLLCLNSAIHNATNNNGLDAHNLFIKKIEVNEGPKIKRFRMKAFGRANTIIKRTTNVTIELAERAPQKKKSEVASTPKK